jgi:hypothetical protein
METANDWVCYKTAGPECTWLRMQQTKASGVLELLEISLLHCECSFLSKAPIMATFGKHDHLVIISISLKVGHSPRKKERVTSGQPPS